MQNSRWSIQGRTALVTGSSQGIGRAIAMQLAAAGARVALHGLHEDELQIVAEDIRSAGGVADVYGEDLSTPGAGRTLVERVLTDVKVLDILVSNVAIQTRTSPLELTPAEISETVHTNLNGFIDLMQTALPEMRSRRWGRIVTIGSVQQARPHPHMLIYAALKAAQVNMVRNLAKQFSADGVTINNIAPGVIDTPRSAGPLSDATYRAQVVGLIPAGYIGLPEDIAGAALLLCSDAGRYITGADLFVDGGMQL